MFQHRQSLKGGISSPGHPRHRRRSDRFLPRLGHLRAMSTCRGASVGGRRGTQRHRALRSVPRETQAVHYVWAGYLLKTRQAEAHAHTRACRVGFPFTHGWGRHQYLHLLKGKKAEVSLLIFRRVFIPTGETCFNNFEPLSILLYLMKKCWSFAPHSVRCVFDLNIFLPFFFFFLKMLLKG